MRKPIIAGNWKMYKTVDEAKRFAEEVKERIPSAEAIDSVICVPAIALDSLVKEAAGTDLKIGAQTMHWEKEGAYTGEISPSQLNALGVEYVIIGHSERRAMFGETDETVNKKVKAAIRHSLHPIVCVGESIEVRKGGQTTAVVRSEIEKAFHGLGEEEASRIVVAYEPIWAIGTGESATPEDADNVCETIRNVLSELYSETTANSIRIQYGGSVNEKNIDSILAMPHIDGALVGGASLDPESFLNLLGAVKRV
ncbi:triose-phosphate isomerase [Pueribacillus theae]|uniref:Triosephosphate isomerase n=1 Tax=Pueribacillus theae TaxID=2171751 RepID=A0A2U1K5U9_9BACI|nr:triose-phosphate isomerase [Pueribacillus theae]PWA12574.1 triose-phosphate isomerase [Pueribacillus theae]